MLLYFALILFLIIIIINIYIFVNINIKENFINDFYDKYIDVISIPVEFYNISAKLPKTQYAVEFNDKFFIDTLNNVKINISINTDINTFNVKDKIIKDDILNRANKYLVKVLNKNLPLDETFLFTNIFTEIINAYQINDNIFMLESKHLIYRDTKIYGVSLTITTLHNTNNNNGSTSKKIKENGTISLIDFILNGFIFEDKINAYQPVNLIDNNYQDYKEDIIQLKDKKYEEQYLCQFYKDVEKFKGITVPYAQTLNC